MKATGSHPLPRINRISTNPYRTSSPPPRQCRIFGTWTVRTTNNAHRAYPYPSFINNAFKWTATDRHDPGHEQRTGSDHIRFHAYDKQYHIRISRYVVFSFFPLSQKYLRFVVDTNKNQSYLYRHQQRENFPEHIK